MLYYMDMMWRNKEETLSFNKTMEQETFKSIIYLEGQVKSLTKDLSILKQSFSELNSEIKAKDIIIESLEKTNERLLKTLEEFNN